MAEPQQKSTSTAFVFEGYAGDEQAYASVFIDPRTDPLNEAGQKALADQNAARSKAGFDPLPELEVRVYLPWPKDGLEAHVDQSFLTAWNNACQKFLAKFPGVKLSFSLDKLGLGQFRIDVNRAITTPIAYKRFTVAGVKLNPKNKKKAAGKKAEAKPTAVAL